MTGYCGYSLEAWRALYRWIRFSDQKFGYLPNNQEAERATRHHVVILCASALLPVEWHAQHGGRLDPRWRERLAGVYQTMPRVHSNHGQGRRRHAR